MSNKIDQLIQEFAQNLQAAIAESAAEAFKAVASGGGWSPTEAKSKPGPKPKGAAPTKPSKRPKGAKRTQAEMEEAKKNILATIKKNHGFRTEEIGAALGLETKDLAGPLLALRESKAVFTKGMRRGMQYFPSKAKG